MARTASRHRHRRLCLSPARSCGARLALPAGTPCGVRAPRGRHDATAAPATGRTLIGCGYGADDGEADEDRDGSESSEGRERREPKERVSVLGERMPTLRLATAVLLTALLGLAPAAAEDAPKQVREDIFPLSAVRPGMKGHGLTVKQGTKIERFEVEVIDIIRNHLVKQDVILVRCLGEAFADHQIAQGMSGSPIYFDGKLAGALAYTWSQAKHPIGGVTPIEIMLAEGDRKLEGRATGMQPPTRLRRGAAKPSASSHELRPIGTPITVAGFSHASRQALAADLAPHGFTVCGGGSAAGGREAQQVAGGHPGGQRRPGACADFGLRDRGCGARQFG